MGPTAAFLPPAGQDTFPNTLRKHAKKHEFATLSSKKKEFLAVQGGLGRRPILKKGLRHPLKLLLVKGEFRWAFFLYSRRMHEKQF
jgi:hypothetical protein